ncbi:Maltose/maltodextrin import ATP-binding protein MalK [compost metagenome]
MTMADRIVVMNQGKIQQIGAPLELYDRPANKFVAGFIGSPSMSFIPGAVIEGGKFRTTDGEEISTPGRKTSERGAELGIRPENFIIAKDGEGLTLAIEVVEPTGPETHVYGKIAGEAVRAVFRERIHLAPGERVPVTAKPEHIHLFDKESGLPL